MVFGKSVFQSIICVTKQLVVVVNFLSHWLLKLSSKSHLHEEEALLTVRDKSPIPYVSTVKLSVLHYILFLIWSHFFALHRMLCKK